MSGKRTAAWALVLVATLSSRGAFASPQTAVAELRAIACCAEHCPPEGRLPMRAKRCCGITSDATAPATASVTFELQTTFAPALAAHCPASNLGGGMQPRHLDVRPRVTGPPPYRLSAKLQR